MAIRRRSEGRLVIEQSRDRERVRAMLSAAGMIAEGVEWPSACYLVAWFGHEAAGVVGIETRVNAALVRSLLVVETMRRRGIGAALLAAARKAAHTRGAKTLYAFSTEAGEFLRRFGFESAPVDELVTALRGAPQVEYYFARPEELAREVAWRLDLSRDGVIVR
jgi:N-acetylglutamate synthase-like GNAT family acetyltransferase